MNIEITDEIIEAVAQKIIESGKLDPVKSDEPKIGDIVVAWDEREIPFIGVFEDQDNSSFPYYVSGWWVNNIKPFNGNVKEALGL